MTQNPCPRHPKTDIFGLVKTLKNHCFYYGLGTLGRPRSDVLAIKTAIVASTAQPTPKNRENVGQVVPKVAKTPKMDPRGGVDEVTFSTFFHQFSFLGPLGAPGGPEVRFLIDLDRFWATLARFRNDFWITFPRFFDPASTWEPRPSDRSIHRAIDFSSIFHPCLADFYRGGNSPGCHNDPRSIDPSITRPRHGGGFAAGSWI